MRIIKNLNLLNLNPLNDIFSLQPLLFLEIVKIISVVKKLVENESTDILFKNFTVLTKSNISESF